jgi:hypothetical protein
VNAEPLQFSGARVATDPLTLYADTPQGQYLIWYLADLQAQSVVIEPQYFDRDYLSEFAAFYCLSSANYGNCCRRLHYFSIDVDRSLIELAASGNKEARDKLQAAYLGFVVLRPIPGTPIGRTVLCWYPDNKPLPRVVEPWRWYFAHLAGIQLRVRGLAWQQQDAGVGACATVALWSMLHSSALDDRHVVPTTAEVTQTAHRAGLSAQPLFPSEGLSFGQLVAAVRDSGFAPLVVAGELPGSRFKREHFCSSLASFIRSGYPALIAGEFEDGSGGHAVCAVGFRQAASTVQPGFIELEDTNTEFVYLHDDNLGPAARFRVEVGAPRDRARWRIGARRNPSRAFHRGVGREQEHVSLRAVPPPKLHQLTLVDPTENYPRFIPTALLAAAHSDVRVTPDRLHLLALNLATMLVELFGRSIGVAASSRVTKLSGYVGKELQRVLAAAPAILSRTRLALWEAVAPMSLHIGVVRIGTSTAPLLDVLYDTTDSVPNMRAFCHVAYDRDIASAVDYLEQLKLFAPGVRVEAY